MSNDSLSSVIPYGLVIDYDYAVVDGVSIVSTALLDALSHAGYAKAAPVTFARYLAGHRASAALPCLLGPGDRVPKVQATSAAAIDEGFAAAQPGGALLEVAKEAADKEIPVLFLTARPPELIEEKLRAAGIEQPLVVGDASVRICEYNPDVWARALTKIGLPPRKCVACVATAESAKRALRTGMSVIAFPPPVLSFQDYSGVQMRASASVTADELFDFLNR